MSLLRRGITGFDTQETVDIRDFKKAIYAVAQGARLSVISITIADGVTPNFYQADILHLDRGLSVICNRSFPIVAMVNLPIKMSGVQPIDVPELADAFRDSGFEVATAAELQRTMKDSDFELLSEGERLQVKYWKPERVCDLVFNWWD